MAGVSPHEATSPAGALQRASLSEINVTPLVDVMLVLLIIFMIASPLIQKGVEVKTPKTAPVVSAAEAGAKLIVTVRREGTTDVVYLGTTRTELARVTEVVRAHPKVQKDRVAFLDADPKVPYGVVVNVMAAIKVAGVELGLVTR
jgi:biopolymer transport protein TolR